MSLKDLKGQ